MTPNRRYFHWFLLLAAVLAGPASAVAGERLQERSEQAVEAAGLHELVVENPRGTTEVRSSADGRLHVVALKIVRAESRRRAESIARLVEVTTDRQGDQFRVTVRYPQRSEVRIGFLQALSGIEFPMAEVRLTIEAPRALALRLEAASGDLTTEDRGGRQTLETRSGDIRVSRAQGPVDASSASGDLTVEDAGPGRYRSRSGDVAVSGTRGALAVETTSGDVNVKGATDSLRVATTSGDIGVDAAPRGLEVQTVSGDLTLHRVAGVVRVRGTSGGGMVELAAPLRLVDVSLVSGDLHVVLAPGLGALLDLHTTSGTLDVNMPLQLGKVDRHAVSGRVGGGGAPVALRTVSGDISVETGER